MIEPRFVYMGSSLTRTTNDMLFEDWSDCKVCFGLGKTKCMFCQEKRPKKQDLSKQELMQFEHWEEKIKFLRTQRAWMIKCNMKSCLDPATDELIRKTIGEWVF